MRAFIFAVAALVALAPVANATPADDQYLAILKERNIGGDPDKMIGYALAACDAYGTPELFAGQVEHMQAIGYTEIQTKVIVGLGMQAYCPDKLSLGHESPRRPRPRPRCSFLPRTKPRPRLQSPPKPLTLRKARLRHRESERLIWLSHNVSCETRRAARG